MTDYRYTIELCDIEDKDRLKAYRKKRDEWLSWLNAGEHQPISDQISAMMWSDAVFRLVNETRKAAIDFGGEFAALNGAIGEAIDRGYVAEQVIAFRKLLEFASKRPERQVVSLRRLLDDVRKNRDLITREIFVCHDGLPFDHNEGRIPTSIRPEGGGLAGVPMHGRKAFPMSLRMHQHFDRYFTQNSPNGRRPESLPDSFFDKLEDEIAGAPFSQAKLYANKILLHAADAHSRGSNSIDGLTLSNIWKCQRALVEVANRLSILIGGPNLGAVPTPQFNVIEHLARPFAPATELIKVRSEWEVENERREGWAD